MNTSSLMFAQDDAYTVQVPEIENVLQRLWREAADEETETAVTHVRTLNLVVFVPVAYASPSVLQSISNVSIHHPGRTIALVVTEDAQSPRANVTIACRKGEGGRYICGEQITLVSGNGGAPLPSIAASLLVPGLPVFLWWHGDPPFSDPIFETLAESANRLIVDSRTWHTPLVTLPSLAQAAQRSFHTAYADLQWTALTSWRQQIAQCFDIPDALPHLQRLKHVIIEHGSDEHDRVAALLLVGWLVSSLGWSSIQASRDHLVAQTKTASVVCELRRHLDVAGIHAITLRSDSAHFLLERISETGCVRTMIELDTALPIERIVHPKVKSLEELIGDELMVLEYDESYIAALRIAAQIMA
jgi:glucose-6-phosphate dehydrogenase assembly protein OpcA